MPKNERKRRGAELMPMNKRRVGSCQGWGRLGWVGSGWVGSVRVWSALVGVGSASHGYQIGFTRVSYRVGSNWIGLVGFDRIESD